MELGQVILNGVRRRVLKERPDLTLIRTQMGLRLERKNSKTASLEFVIETGTFFTITINLHTFEHHAEDDQAYLIFDAIIKGRCRQTRWSIGESVKKIRTTVFLADGRTIQYERSDFLVFETRCESRSLTFQPY